MKPNIIKLTTDVPVTINIGDWSVSGDEPISVAGALDSGTTSPKLVLSRYALPGESLLLSNASQGINNLPIDNRLEEPEQLGVRFTKSSFSDLSDFTASGGITTSIVANAIRLIASGGGLDKYISLNNVYTTAKRWQMDIEFIIQERTGATYGIAIGLIPQNVFSNLFDAFGFFTNYTGVVGYSDYYGQGVQRASSGAGFSSSVMDKIHVRLTRNGDTFVVMSYLVGTPASTSSKSYTYDLSALAEPLMVNNAQPAIVVAGGTYDVTFFEFRINDLKNNLVVVIPDSKEVGYTSSSDSNRFSSQLAAYIGGNSVVLNAGAGDGLDEALQRVDELTSLNAAIYLMNGASNNIRGGQNINDIWAKYQALTTALEAVGRVIHTTGWYEEIGSGSAVDQEPLRALILGTYTDVIDTLPTVLTLNFDKAHPTAADQTVMKGVLIDSGKFDGLPIPAPVYFDDDFTDLNIVDIDGRLTPIGNGIWTKVAGTGTIGIVSNAIKLTSNGSTYGAYAVECFTNDNIKLTLYIQTPSGGVMLGGLCLVDSLNYIELNTIDCSIHAYVAGSPVLSVSGSGVSIAGDNVSIEKVGLHIITRRNGTIIAQGDLPGAFSGTKIVITDYQQTDGVISRVKTEAV